MSPLNSKTLYHTTLNSMRKIPPFSASGPHMSFLRSLPLKTNFLAILLGPVSLLTLESAYGGGQIGRYT